MRRHRSTRVAAALAGLVACLAAPTRGEDLLLNGDFEDNSVGGCGFNIASADLGSVLAGATGFGDAFGTGDIDVMNDAAGCGFGLPPVSGTTKLGLAADDMGRADALSLDLSAPLVAGQLYRVSFYAQAVVDFFPTIGPVQVGVSDDPAAFGTTVFEATPEASWGYFTSVFEAPTGAAYLTIRVAGVQVWNHVDDFSLATAGQWTCYQAKDLRNPKFGKRRDVPVRDEYGDGAIDVQKPFLVCGAAEVDGLGQSDDDHHLCCYKAKGPKLDPALNRFETDDAFGDLDLELKKAKLVCLPCRRTPLP